MLDGSRRGDVAHRGEGTLTGGGRGRGAGPDGASGAHPARLLLAHALRAAEEAARVERWPGSTLRPTAYTVREEEATKLVVRACPPDRFIEASMSLSTPSRTTSGTRLRGGWHEEPQGTSEASVLREPAASGHARRLAYAHHARGGLGTRREGEGLSGAGLAYLLSVCCWSSVLRRWSSTSFWPSGETGGLCPSGAGTPDGLSRWPGVGVSGPGAF